MEGNAEKKVESWFDRPERVAALVFEAGKWEGTPWFPNSNTPGRRGGVSCQKLVKEIYGGCGFCAEVEAPSVPMNHAQFAQDDSQSLVEEFMATRPEFKRLAGPPWELLAGDLVAVKIRRVNHHLGIVLPGNGFLHVMDRLGTTISRLDDGTWLTRVRAVWRPVGGEREEGRGERWEI